MPRAKKQLTRQEIAAKTAKDMEAAYHMYLRRKRLARGEAAKHSQSVRHLAREYGVPLATLQQRIKGRRTLKEFNQEKQVISPGEEATLVDHVIYLQQHGFPVRPRHLHQLARQLLEAKGSMHELGHTWVSKFISRHPHLRSTIVRPRKYHRAYAETPANFQRFYDLFRELVDDFKILPENIWNMDEKGCMMGVQGKAIRIVLKSERAPFLVHNGSRKWTTMIEAISMGNQMLDPFFIFKGKKVLSSWVQQLDTHGYSHGRINMSKNGWTTVDLGLSWLELTFNPQTSASLQENQWRLLLLDGHSSHISRQFVQFAIQNKIKLLGLPSHTTHRLQPLDVGCFGPLAQHYHSVLEEHSTYGGMSSLDNDVFIDLYIMARKRAVRASNVESAWAKTGLQPFEPSLTINALPPLLEPAPAVISNAIESWEIDYFTDSSEAHESDHKVDYLKTPAKLGDGARIAKRFLKEHSSFSEDFSQFRRYIQSMAKGFECQAAISNLCQVEVNKFIVNQKKKKKKGKKETMGQAQEYGVQDLKRRDEDAKKDLAKVAKELFQMSLRLYPAPRKPRSRAKSHSPVKSRSPAKSPAKRAPRILPTLEEELPIRILDNSDEEDVQILSARNISASFQPISLPAPPTAPPTAPPPKKKPAQKAQKPAPPTAPPTAPPPKKKSARKARKPVPPPPPPPPAQPTRTTHSGRVVRTRTRYDG